MLATLDHGDTVLVPNPSYPIHIYGAVIAGRRYAQCRWWKVSISSTNWSAPFVKAYPKPKMMILGFPSNPTAQCVELEFFEKVVALAKRYDVLVVHDLAYADIVYDGWKAPSIMQVPGARDVAVEFFTLSKSYNMAGWRIGFMVGNKTLVSALARIKSYHDYAPLRRCRWRRLRRWRAIDSACATLPNSTNAAVMYWLKGCMKRAGWLKCRRLRCMSGEIRNHMRPWDR